MSGRGRQRAGDRGGRDTVRRRGGRERRVLLVGLTLSAILHLLVIGTIGDLLRGPPATAPPPPVGVSMPEAPPGIRVVRVSPVPGPTPDAPDRLDTPDRPEPAESPRLRPTRTVVVEADPATPADDLSAADRLAPRLVEPRLWRPLVLIPREPTFEDVEARIAAAIELLNDSALAEVERAMRARDWTVEDANGGKWGISPGKLHLGSLTLPLPVAFPTSVDAAAREAEWYDLEAQVDRTRFLESFEDRVKAIRERREKERAERAGPNGGGASDDA